MEIELFRDRKDAGKKLSEQLLQYKNGNTYVIAIPRGGVPIGYEVVKHLHAHFDIIVTRKIPIPWNPEAGFGAVSDDGTMVLNDSMVRGLGISEEEIEEAAAQVRQEIDRRIKKYRGDKPEADIEGKTVILVDDGLASGYTMLAAIESLRKRKPAQIIAALPVASRGAARLISPKVDKLVVLIIGERLPFAIASFYMIWNELMDDDVIDYIRRAEEITSKK